MKMVLMPSTMPRCLTAALQGMMANKSSKHMIYMVLFARVPRASGIQQASSFPLASA